MVHLRVLEPRLWVLVPLSQQPLQIEFSKEADPLEGVRLLVGISVLMRKIL